MKSFLRTIKSFIIRIALRLSKYWIYLPLPISHRIMRRFRRFFGIQLSSQQMVYIGRQICTYENCNLFVFGLGNDSLLWTSINRDGRSVFFEEDQEWCSRIAAKSKRIEAYHVIYHTTLLKWRTYLYHPEFLTLPLPERVSNTSWDFVLVDGPRGYDHHPGRMTSIYMSRKLIGESGDVVVHDCQRVVEKAYSDKYLGEEHHVRSIDGEAGLLKHYRF